MNKALLVYVPLSSELGSSAVTQYGIGRVETVNLCGFTTNDFSHIVRRVLGLRPCSAVHGTFRHLEQHYFLLIPTTVVLTAFGPLKKDLAGRTVSEMRHWRWSSHQFPLVTMDFTQATALGCVRVRQGDLRLTKRQDGDFRPPRRIIVKPEQELPHSIRGEL